MNLILRLLGFYGALGSTAMLCSQESGTMESRSEAVLSGVVVDGTGAVVRNATVRLQPGNSGQLPVELQQTTDALGRYRFRVAPGNYTLTVQAPGFAVFEKRSLKLRADASVELTAHLVVENLRQEVSVPGDETGAADPNHSAGAVTFEGKSLSLLANDDATLRQQLQALAGTIGTPTFLVNGFSGGRLPPKAAIRSIRINENPYSSYYAEYGAGRVEIATQPGGDSLHGSLQLSGTDRVLDARNPYTVLKPDFYDFQQQGNVSGPLGKRTSYFVSDSVEQLANSSVVNGADPKAPALQISTTAPSPLTTQVYALRVDRKFGAENYGYFREEWSDTSQRNAGIVPLVLPEAAFASHTLTNALQMADTQIIGTRSANEVRFQYLRTRVRQEPNSVLPSIIVQSAFQSGGAPMQALDDKQDAYELQDIFESERGHHALRSGFRMRVLREANRSSAGFNGQYIFPDTVSYLAGRPTQYSQTVGQQKAVLLNDDFGVFAEDDWKVTPTFTLSYGMRFESQSAVPDHSDPAPRLAFSWAVQPGKRTAPVVIVRGGYGIFYDRFPVPPLLQSVRQNGTRQIAYYAQNTGFDPLGPPPGVDLTASEPTIYEVNPKLRSSYTQAAGATVERGIGHYGTVSANFLFAHDTHVPLTRNMNAPLPGAALPVGPGNGVRPFGAGNLYAFSSDANGNLERFYLNFHLQPTSHLLFYGVFNAEKHNTESDGIDHFPSNEYNIRQDYGRSVLNRSQWFTGGFQYNLPLGFSVTPFLDAHSGVPFDITTGNDGNGDTIYNDRPAFAVNPAGASVVKTAFGTFDLAPTPGAAVIPRNAGTSPAYVWLQVQVSKDFHLGPKPQRQSQSSASQAGPAQDRPWDLNLSVEVNNITNHNNPGPPVGVISAQPCDSSGKSGCVCPGGQCTLVPSGFFGRSLSLASDFSPATASNRVILLQTSFSW